MKSLLLTIIIGLSVMIQLPATAQQAACPPNYFELQLPANSKLCRIFGVKKPSTLSFYLNASPESALQHFKKQLPDAQQTNTQNGNAALLSLVSQQPAIRVYVYPDGAGTQVNIKAE